MTTRLLLALLAALAAALPAKAQTDPAAEPAVIAVSKAMPAVVNINTERVIKRTVRDPMDEVFNQFFGGPMQRPRVLSQKVQSLGSGFIVDPSGYIVTNEHVIAGEYNISVTQFRRGATELEKVQYNKVRIVALDSRLDLALLKIEDAGPAPFPTVSLRYLEV
jgi:serine protease Do